MQTYNKILRAFSAQIKTSASRNLTFSKVGNFSILLSAREVSQARINGKPIILHASSFPKENKRITYDMERIPGARLFDIDTISDKNSDLDRTLPQPADFIDQMKALGINATDEVIAYDDNGIMGGTRALWMLNAYGNYNVKILDGGFSQWKEQRKPVENGEETWADQYHRGGEGFELQKNRVTNIHEIRDFAYGVIRDTELIDARRENVFRGETANGGHIPNSKNVPFNLLLDETGRFKKPEEIKQIFESRGANLSKNIICTCLNGMASTVLYAALKMIGKDEVAVYDGSWEEWCKFPENETMRTVDFHNQHQQQQRSRAAAH